MSLKAKNILLKNLIKGSPMNISPEDFKTKLLNNEHLPEGLVVEGSLDLEGCTSLTHLPEGLVVGGWLSLYRCTSLTHLPSGLVVNGGLYLYGCTSLTHLPAGLVINGGLYGSLDLRGCTSLTHLPAGLVVKDTIYCDESLIDTIPFEDLPLYINYKFEESIHEHLVQRLQSKAA
jgi:hypothetical protein